MKLIILLFLFGILPIIAYAQNNPANHTMPPTVGKINRMISKGPQVLIVKGDSLFTIPDVTLMRYYLAKQEGFIIINDPDSIRSFLDGKIKSMIILKKKEE